MAKKMQEPKEATADQQTIEKAIAEGRAMIDQGSSKIDAAMAIYRLLEDQPQETIVQAFQTGATLTEKGALTYWYNCRRKLAKEKRANASG
ncbi:isoaspartyl peptidase/L-asparaginase [Aquibium sp. ELW1220]|uniref:isoaspartyl peptidase/L-asparaginase n=1 Tax=Aquibium sp. ELW1220 TaxID=2976766 RepID=UPI0025B2596F|nr:isoaspartyl peptidase/L-asparaginase [Aquibium sp. ELW1220]MDN2584353.1 isoaspartyl peptidase/L-asparaginase [Aquibium sp. ELW1220]